MTEPVKQKLWQLAPLAAFVLLAVLILGAIAVLPYDLPGTTPPNTYGNLHNGGTVAEDGTMLYYVNGKGVLYCLSSPNCYRIDEDASALCPYENGVVYRRKNGDVVYSDYRGETKKTVVTETETAVVSGNWVFFTRQDGVLCKKSLLTEREVCLNLSVREYLVASNTVLYTDADGYLNTALTDGTQTTRFFAKTVDTFTRYKGYVFCVRDGVLFSVATANAASQQTYFAVNEFNITEEGVIVFTDDEGLHTYNLTEEKPKVRNVEIHGSSATQLSVYGEKMVYNNGDGQRILCQLDGSEWQYLQ